MSSLPSLDLLAEADYIASAVRDMVFTRLKRRGLVVSISGGIDSSLCAALAVKAVGASRVLGLLQPEKDSSGASRQLGELLAMHLGIRYEVHDLAPALDAIGCYKIQHEVLTRVFPGYQPDWKFKLAIAEAMGGQVSITKVIAASPGGQMHEERLRVGDYLRLVAATNFKQRLRKVMDYFHADANNYAVVGTPNRLEYDQGFFVKLGDGSADVKPIAHLFKTQVYDMARALGLPGEITSTTPTTDTFSLPQGQDEFYFGLPYPKMDLAIHFMNSGLPASALAQEFSCSDAAAEAIYAGIGAKRKTTAYLHQSALLVRPVPQVG
jgi:NAD+ synthase